VASRDGPAGRARGASAEFVCYTTGRWTGVRVRHGAPLADRLVRDAARLGLGALDLEGCLAALERAGREAFGAGEGVVRLDARRGEGGEPQLVAQTRPVGPEPDAWSAVVARALHEGPGPFPGAKRSPWACIEQARAETAAARVDDALLFDAAGRLVEAGRTSLVVVRADGRALTPPLARGGVRSVAREIALAAHAEIAEGDVTLDEVRRARELVALNAVRGARPIVRLDARPVGAGTPGPLAVALRSLLDAAE
jgi:branched-subunit amino acid aminotransferase/4-amino-4-deoxychorismate lyase